MAHEYLNEVFCPINKSMVMEFHHFYVNGRAFRIIKIFVIFSTKCEKMKEHGARVNWVVRKMEK
jgi:hypothetical protein